MTLGLRRSLVAVLLIALTLTGLGRALASTVPSEGFHDVIPGVHVPICHSGAGENPADPVQPISHDCCDDCALLGIAVLPAPPILSRPASLEHFAEHAQAISWSPVMARPAIPACLGVHLPRDLTSREPFPIHNLGRSARLARSGLLP